jgi:septal ring factor EnvC (AmiA/AmiB activator)
LRRRELKDIKKDKDEQHKLETEFKSVNEEITNLTDGIKF